MTTNWKNICISGRPLKTLYLDGRMIWKKDTIENPYLEPNLIAQWDGIWNVGLGKHDSSSTVWKDLAGNYDVHTNDSRCNGTFSNNGLVCHGVKLAAIGDVGKVLPYNTNSEVEAVVTFPSDVKTSSNFAWFYFHGGGYYTVDPNYPKAARNVLWIDTRAQYSRFGTAFVGAPYGLYRFSGTVKAGIHAFRYPGIAASLSGGISANRPWLDGVPISTTLNANGATAWTDPGSRMTFGGGLHYDGSIILPTGNGFVINALRWYSSPLTPEQRQKHWLADKERFGIS